jgi:hypothetical protein
VFLKSKQNAFLGKKNFFFCPYAMASRTRYRQQLLQTSSSQKLLHLTTLFFAHMLLGLVPTNFVHNSFIKCTQGTQRAKMCQKNISFKNLLLQNQKWCRKTEYSFE